MNSVPFGFEETGARHVRSGERAPLVPKEGGLHEIGRDRGAIEHDEWPARPRTEIVQRLCQDLLTGSRLSFDDDGDVRRRDPRHRGVKATDLGAGANERAEMRLFEGRLFEALAGHHAEHRVADLHRLAPLQDDVVEIAA
jgi:hypothetical protein